MNLYDPQHGTLDLNDAIERSHPLNINRVGLWMFPSGYEGSRLPDLTGRWPSTITSATRTRIGVGGRTKTLNYASGTHDYAQNSLAITLNSAFTVSCWYRTTQSAASGAQVFFSVYNDGASAGALLQCNRASVAGVSFTVNYAAGSHCDYATSLANDGNWHHLVGVYGSGNGSLYFDGVQVFAPASKSAYAGSSDTCRIGSYKFSSQDFVGNICSSSVWTRALSASEVWAEYCTSSQDYATPNSPLKWGRSRKWFFVAPTITTYTGTAAISTTATTIAASGTRTVPTFTGTATLTTEAATIAGSGTHVGPSYTGTATLTTEVATISASGTFTAPTFTATASLTTEAATLTASGTHTTPAYTATASFTTEAATLDASGTHTAPAFTGSPTLATEAATIAGTGTFTAPVYTAAVALATEVVALAADGTHAAPTATGTASLTTESAALDAIGTHTAPAYTAAAALSTDAATLDASGTHTVPAYTGTASLATDAATIAASGTHTAPAYTGTAALNIDPAAMSASGTFAPPT